MDETRVDRYRDYRRSFIKEGAIVSDASEGDEYSDVASTTSTLPMDKVIDAVQEGEKEAAFLKRKRTKASLKLVIEIGIVVLLIIGLVVLGIFAWGK